MADMQAFEQECTQFFRPLWPGEDKILVFGDGNTDHPPLMLIGEAPGEQETLKRRPFVASGRVRNRAPSKEEIALFLPFLMKEIDLVAPRALVTLGNVPLRALTGDKSTIGDMHGAWHTAVNGLPLFALYHPAAIIYRRELLSVYEQDVRCLRDSLTIQT